MTLWGTVPRPHILEPSHIYLTSLQTNILTESKRVRVEKAASDDDDVRKQPAAPVNFVFQPYCVLESNTQPTASVVNTLLLFFILLITLLMSSNIRLL